MKTLGIIISLFFCYAFTTPSATVTHVVLEFENLSPDIYKQYVLRSMENSEIEIMEACVPAHLLYIKYSGNLDQNGQETVLDFFQLPNSSGSITLLLDHTLVEFTERCADARLGN